MDITQLVITKKNTKSWVYRVNDEPEDRFASAYTGTGVGDYLTIKTYTGGIQVMNVPYTAISYIDELDADNNRESFDSQQEASIYLNEQGFYQGSAGGSSGGATTFLQLLDTFLSYGGRDGQVLYVDDNTINSMPASMVSTMQSLANWLGGVNTPPNQYVLSSSIVDEDGNSTGFITASIDAIVNRPNPYLNLRIINKGVQIVSGTPVPNLEDFVLEVGDTVSGWKDSTTVWHEAMYNGGDPNNRDNYTPLIETQVR